MSSTLMSLKTGHVTFKWKSNKKWTGNDSSLGNLLLFLSLCLLPWLRIWSRALSRSKLLCKTAVTAVGSCNVSPRIEWSWSIQDDNFAETWRNSIMKWIFLRHTVTTLNLQIRKSKLATGRQLSTCWTNISVLTTIIQSPFSYRRALTKISNCWVNMKCRQGIIQLRISFGSLFLLFPHKSRWRLWL